MKKGMLGAAFCWVFIHVARYIHHPVPLLNGYLTDILAVPVIAQLCLWATRRFVLRNPEYTYPFWYYLFMAGYLSIVFEWILPHWSSRYTSDAWDAVAYFAGALICMRWQARRPFNNTKKSAEDQCPIRKASGPSRLDDTISPSCPLSYNC